MIFSQLLLYFRECEVVPFGCNLGGVVGEGGCRNGIFSFFNKTSVQITDIQAVRMCPCI